MSGFERSAPIPGSQGPRRSEMRRYNNAPPPESPWRLEVLEAKKQAEAAVRKATQRSKSRSRSRDRERDRERRKGGGAGASAAGSASSSSGNKKVEHQPQDTSKEAIFKKIVKAREVGEGWFAAVSAASSRWDSIPEHKRPKGVGAPAVSSQKAKDERKRPDMEDRDKERKAKEEKARVAKELQEESERRAEQKREKERLEKVWAAEAEEREKRRLEEKKRLEDDRRSKEQAEKQRKKKLGNAFCVDGDEDENEIQKREAQLLKRAAERKKNLFEEPDLGGSVVPGNPVMAQAMSMVGIGDSKSSPLESEFAGRLGFEGCLDPAEAFIRLQERKRKGRRAEFGGPPRGCSPWRDGKRGVVTPLAEKERDREGKR